MIAAVLVAVHHAEVIAHRIGEPLGTLVLAVAVTVIEVAVWAVMVPAVVPNVTAVTPVNPVPVMVTDVPPATNPWVGLMLVTTGAGR